MSNNDGISSLGTTTNNKMKDIIHELSKEIIEISSSKNNHERYNNNNDNDHVAPVVVQQMLSFLKQAETDEHVCMEGITLTGNNKAQCNAIRWLAEAAAQEEEDALLLYSQPTSTEFLQRYVLAVLYFSTNGDDDWLQCSRQPSVPCDDESSLLSRFLSTTTSVCNWYGIKCQTDINNDNNNNRIIWIDLANNGLKSDNVVDVDNIDNVKTSSCIVNEIWLLNNHLEVLWMPSNPLLGGTLPSWIGDMTSLQSLSLFDTGLLGTIPVGLYDLTHLNALRLYGNHLGGTIATDIQKLNKNLSWLWLHGNKLEGSIPHQIGTLTKLEGLTLHQNQFENKQTSFYVPHAICSLRELNLNLLWTDCTSTTGTNDPDDLHCDCCTRCFIENTN